MIPFRISRLCSQFTKNFSVFLSLLINVLLNHTDADANYFPSFVTCAVSEFRPAPDLIFDAPVFFYGFCNLIGCSSKQLSLEFLLIELYLLVYPHKTRLVYNCPPNITPETQEE